MKRQIKLIDKFLADSARQKRNAQINRKPVVLKNPASLTERQEVMVMMHIVTSQVPAWQRGMLCSRK